MKCIDKLVDSFALNVARRVIASMHDDINLVRNAIVKIANNVQPLPAYMMIESPDGYQAVSEICWLLPGERKPVSFHCYREFPIGSTVKTNYPFWIYNLMICNAYQIESEAQACITCKTTESILPIQKVSADIYYPAAPKE